MSYKKILKDTGRKVSEEFKITKHITENFSSHSLGCRYAIEANNLVLTLFYHKMPEDAKAFLSKAAIHSPVRKCLGIRHLEN